MFHKGASPGSPLSHFAPTVIPLSVVSLHFRTKPHMTPAKAEVPRVTLSTGEINPAQFTIQFILCILMDSQQPSSQAAVNAYDDNSFIRIDDSRREQPADNTCRPVHDPVRDRGYNFKPVAIPSQLFEITDLPPEPLLLFQQFLPVS